MGAKITLHLERELITTSTYDNYFHVTYVASLPICAQIALETAIHTAEPTSNLSHQFVKKLYFFNMIFCHKQMKFFMVGMRADYLYHLSLITDRGQATHICVSNQNIIGSDNGRRQTIIWTDDGMLLIGTLGTNFSEMLIDILLLSFKKMRLKVSSAKWRPFCLGHNVFSEVLSPWLRFPKIALITSLPLASNTNKGTDVDIIGC